MLRIRRNEGSAGEDARLRAMFAARKRVFVDILKWDLPVLAGAYEVDRFDTPSAEYLIRMNADGTHRASARLLATEAPHILSELYPGLCAGRIPAGPTVREITRFCIDPGQAAAERRAARDELVTGLVHYALANEITDYTGVANQAWFEQIRRFGWDCRSLGSPVRIGRDTLVALHIRITTATPALLASAGIMSSPETATAGSEERLS